MIKTYLYVQIGNATFTFNGVRRDLAPGTDAAAHAAAALLRSAADALDAAMEPVDENGNRQCYLCGFYHDEPGSCANGTPTNITPGPDDEPEYDGPTDNDSDRFMPEVGDENDRPFDDADDDEDTSINDNMYGPWDGPEDGDYSAGQDKPPLVTNLNIATQSVADIVRERIGRSVVEASKQESVQCQEDKHWHCHALMRDCACECHIGEAARGRSIKRDEADQ